MATGGARRRGRRVVAGRRGRDRPVGGVGEIDQREDLLHPGGWDMGGGREELEVLAGREVVVDGGSLGHVADGAARVGAPRRSPEDAHVPLATRCKPTMARISVVLPEPLGPAVP